MSKYLTPDEHRIVFRRAIKDTLDEGYSRDQLISAVKRSIRDFNTVFADIGSISETEAVSIIDQIVKQRRLN
jgi:hypothetical protein